MFVESNNKEVGCVLYVFSNFILSVIQFYPTYNSINPHQFIP